MVSGASVREKGGRPGAQATSRLQSWSGLAEKVWDWVRDRADRMSAAKWEVKEGTGERVFGCLSEKMGATATRAGEAHARAHEDHREKGGDSRGYSHKLQSLGEKDHEGGSGRFLFPTTSNGFQSTFSPNAVIFFLSFLPLHLWCAVSPSGPT